MAEDIDLIKKVKQSKDEESLKELIDRHSGIYLDMVNKYIPNFHEGIYKKDIIQEKDFSIYDAIIKFDESKKTKFSTYLGNITKWKCLNIYNKKLKFPQESVDSAVYVTRMGDRFSGDYSELKQDPDINHIEEVENMQNVHNIVNNFKDERVKEIFEMRYNYGQKLTPWKKIAKKLDLSIQGCINIHNKYLEEIKKLCSINQ